MAVVMGIDPSLTSTGFVVLRDGQLLEHAAFHTRTTGPVRLLEIQDQMLARIRDHRPELVAIEGYAFGVRGGAAFSLGELGGVLRVGMHLRSAKWIEVAPSQVKKFATGKGVAEKDQMLLTVFKRWGIEFKTHDEADAYVLAQIARAAVEGSDGLTQFQKEVVAEIMVPKMKGKKAKAG